MGPISGSLQGLGSGEGAGKLGERQGRVSSTLRPQHCYRA